MILDFDLDFLKEATALVDGRLAHLERKAAGHLDPDTFGVYDECEYITGFGFVACQTYARVSLVKCRNKKVNWLALGPKHRSGLTMIDLIHAAANYWKHSAEWDLDVSKPSARKTIDVLRKIGVNDDADWPLANTLQLILTPHTPRFTNLIPFLTQWRDALP